MSMRWLVLFAVALMSSGVVASSGTATNAQTPDGPRIGESVDLFDAAFGPSGRGDAYSHYRLEDGGLIFATSEDDRVTVLKRFWTDIPTVYQVGEARDGFLPDDAMPVWTSSGPNLPYAAGFSVELWHSDSLATTAPVHSTYTDGTIVVTYFLPDSGGNFEIVMSLEKTAFSVGDPVYVTDDVLSTPGADRVVVRNLDNRFDTEATIIGAAELGSDGRIYYHIELEDGTIGWVAQFDVRRRAE